MHLNLMEKQRYLRHIHCFSVPLDSEDSETRMMSHYPLKRKLAEFAISLVTPGETVFIDNGSNNELLARMLAALQDITIILTVSCYIARLLKDTH